jgi:DNA-dependent RNA polymerase auxiliary subunit epsilon
MSKPLFIVPDDTHYPPRRYMVKDDKENILFMTDLNDKEAERNAVLWAMKQGGWLQGIIKGGKMISDSNIFDFESSGLKIEIGKPLYIIPDTTHNPPKRLMVIDEEKNVLFITDINDEEYEQTATYAAMKLGGWLKGAVKSIQK